MVADVSGQHRKQIRQSHTISDEGKHTRTPRPEQIAYMRLSAGRGSYGRGGHLSRHAASTRRAWCIVQWLLIRQVRESVRHVSYKRCGAVTHAHPTTTTTTTTWHVWPGEGGLRTQMIRGCWLLAAENKREPKESKSFGGAKIWSKRERE